MTIAGKIIFDDSLFYIRKRTDKPSFSHVCTKQTKYKTTNTYTLINMQADGNCRKNLAFAVSLSVSVLCVRISCPLQVLRSTRQYTGISSRTSHKARCGLL